MIKVKNKEELRSIRKSRPDNADLNDLDVSGITNFSRTFAWSSFNGDISKWDVSNAKNMNAMFEGSSFNGDISKWDVSNVTDMEYMFAQSDFKKIKKILMWKFNPKVKLKYFTKKISTLDDILKLRKKKLGKFRKLLDI